MHDHTRWSIGLGRWRGVQIRVHGFFVLFAAVALYVSWRERPPDEAARLDWLAIQALAVLFASVLWHEAAHAWVARWFGADADFLVIGPLGGLTPRPPLPDAQAELLVHAVGPGANLAVCLLGLPTLVASSSSILGLLHPFAPVGLTEGGVGLVLVKLAFWVNWCLFLVNLLPAYPFDGGRVLQAFVRKRWPGLGFAAVAFLVLAVAQMTALGLLVVAFLLPSAELRPAMPPRFALLLLAILLFLCAKRDEYEQRQTAAAVDTDEPDHEPPADGRARPDQAPVKSWLKRRRQQRLQQQREREAEEERQVDEILARLHEHGLESLSTEDRRLLDRVSRRYRARLGR